MTRGPQPAGYVVPLTLQFAGINNVPVMQRLFGTAAPTVAQCLGVWERVTDLLAQNGFPTGDETQARNAIVGRVGDIYRRAAPYLLGGLGAYCSYCESPLYGQFDVEHAMPKNSYPLFCLEWTNFLVACTACNSPKGDNPTRAVTRGILLRRYGVANPTRQDYRNLIRAVRYTWPDLDPQSYRRLPIEFTYDDATGHHVLSPLEAGDQGVSWVRSDPATLRVYANVVDAGVPKLNVWVRARPAPATQPATRLSHLCTLRRNSATITDRRVYNRTLAWLTAAENMNRMFQAPAAQLPWVWLMFMGLARQSGFYSVWLTLLTAQLPGWGQLFVAQTNNARDFPGTNPLNLP